MSMMTAQGPAPRLRIRRLWRALFRKRHLRRRLRHVDARFWALINDHDWLQYHPCDSRLRSVLTRPRRKRQW